MAGVEGDMETDTVPAELDSRQLHPESHDKAPEDMEVNLTAASSSQTATEQREASPQAGITSGMAAPASTAPTSTASSSTPSAPYVMATTAMGAFNNPNYNLTIFLNAISDEITDDVFRQMKFICTESGFITKSKMQRIKDTRDLFTGLREGAYIKPYDLLMLQSLLWFSGARDLFKKVVDFASDQMEKPLHLFAPSYEPMNGYKHVKFHLRGADHTHTPELVQSLRSQVAALMQVPSTFVFIEGIETGSLWITLAVPEFLCDTLLDRLEKTPSVLSHWSVVQVALGDRVLDLEGCSLEAEQAEEPSPLDKLYQENRELRALVEDGRQRLAGIEAAFQECSSAAQDWLQHPDTECQQLLLGLQKPQKMAVPVVSKKDHIFRGRPIYATLHKDDVSGEACTVRVTGLDPSLHDPFLEMHFESERRSGGGAVKALERKKGGTEAVITFEESSVAQRVVAWTNPTIRGRPVSISFCKDDVSGEACTVRVTGLDPGLHDDALEMHFESERRSGGGAVKALERRKGGTEAVITFEESEVAKRVVSKPNQEIRSWPVRVERYDGGDSGGMGGESAVKVTGLPPEADNDEVEMYFESKRKSGGGDISKKIEA